MSIAGLARAVVIASPAAYSVYTLVSGARLARSGRRYIRARSIGAFGLANWTRSLLKSGVFAGDPDVDLETRTQVILNWIHVAGRVLLGRGIGMFVGVLPGVVISGVLLVVVLRGGVQLTILDLIEAYLIGISLQMSVIALASGLLGQGLGMLRGYASIALKDEGMASEAVAPQALREYRSTLWTTLSLGMTLMVFVFLVPAVLTNVAVASTYPDRLVASEVMVVVGVCVVGSLLVFLGAEFFVRRVAVQPPARFSWSIPLATRTDGIYRSLIIGALTSVEVSSLGVYLGISLASVGALLAIALPLAAIALYLAGIGILLTSSWAGVTVWRMRGRLGGRLTGWPRMR